MILRKHTLFSILAAASAMIITVADYLLEYTGEPGGHLWYNMLRRFE
ncbi:MAG TPA: hypothetical protein VIM13_10120 [Clostridia bacterium]|nr:hypothetical protein [Clostridiales bacterium]